MVDLAPEGCSSLRDFYDAFTSWKWNTNNVIGELGLEDRIALLPDERKGEHRARLAEVTDASLSEAVRLFASGELQAFIVLPGADRRVISQRAWIEAFFPERLFLDIAIDEGHGDEFDAAVGRTPFVSTESARTYFRANEKKKSETRASLALRELLIGMVMDGVARPAEAEDFRYRWNLRAMEERPSADRYDPIKSTAWTLAMALTWILFRNPYAVREAMDDYRANWWSWAGLDRRLPLGGGERWFEVHGAELRTLEPLSLSGLKMIEASARDGEESATRISVKDAREDLWSKLAEGVLKATAINPDGKVVQIPSHEWPYLTLEADGKLMDRLVFANGRRAMAYDKVTVRQSDVLATWDGYFEPPDPPLMSYLAEQSTWTFLEAATWVGCKGKELPSKQIADEDLEERGAYALFKALFERRLVATGLNRKRLREPIPAEYWEMATMNPERFGERHYLSFIDDVLHGYGGQLTPVGEESPRWFGIRVDRDAMFAAFPEIAASFALSAEGLDPMSSTGGRKLAAAREAIQALHPHGVPKGLTDKELRTAVNTWLKNNGHSEVSPRTLARAKLG